MFRYDPEDEVEKGLVHSLNL